MPEVTSGWGRLTWDQSQWGGSTVLQTGWGSDSWGDENWGESSLDVSLTGLSTTSSIGAAFGTAKSQTITPINQIK